jgi:formylglycine-generating enzyme required for sulfatase activity
VPAGAYPYGEQNETLDIEAPFLLGRYPVTNGQYRAFLDDGGYGKRDCWSEAGWAWRQREKISEPRFWRGRRWNGPNQPVVGVSFWEAEACCRWAGGRLPREQEWEVAARGRDGYRYPWGNDWQDGICNSEEAGLGVTSPVGLFPGSRQRPLGLEDLAGNVWSGATAFTIRKRSTIRRRCACCAAAPSSTGPGTCGRPSGAGTIPRSGSGSTAFAVCLPRPASVDPLSL